MQSALFNYYKTRQRNNHKVFKLGLSVSLLKNNYRDTYYTNLGMALSWQLAESDVDIYISDSADIEMMIDSLDT